MKTAELTGPALDWAVWAALGKDGPVYFQIDHTNPRHLQSFHDLRGGHPIHQQARWSERWDQGGPIIEREDISIDQREGEPCRAFTGTPVHHTFAMFAPHGRPLIAAMRCFVASKLGEEVNIPKELQA
jgi:hypothetical protein